MERAAGIIRRTVAAQAQIIDDLLDLSRINTGKLTLTRSTVDWASSVDMIVSAMQEEAASRGVVLGIEKTAPLLIDADPVRVEQIVWNLLSNAVKFTPAGGKVTLKLERDGECARLEVRDTGRGIAPDALPHVFEMFKQVEPSGARLQGGLGIGLAVVRHLVQLHGGRIEASSNGLGAGSTFTCWLPLAPVDTPAHEDGAARPHRLARRQVLLVDDDHASVETLRHLLEGEGMGVEHAASGPEALEKARRHRFDVVLTDIAMPNMDGHALLRALREDGRYEDVPVLALTGMARADDVRRALDAGFRAHLSKPISADRLFAALDEVLAGSEAPSH